MNEPIVGDTRTIIQGNSTENQIYIECPLCHECRWSERRNGVARYPICKHHKPTPQTAEAKKNNSIGLKKSYLDPIKKASHALGQKKRYERQEERELQSARRIQYAKDNPEYIETQRKDGVKHWADPEYAHKQRMRMLQYNRKEMTRQEVIMQSILTEYFPNEWEYVGNNGKGLIGNKVPDFIHANGRKLAIECFGDFWHDPIRNKSLLYHQTFQGRTEFLNANGYEVLILWEHEIHKTPKDKIAERVKQFMNN